MRVFKNINPRSSDHKDIFFYVSNFEKMNVHWTYCDNHDEGESSHYAV